MNSLDVELALDRLEARLAAELPAHVAAAARAYADGTGGPSAIAITDAEIAAVQRGLAVRDQHRRAVQLLRAMFPIVVDGDHAVAAARAQERSWQGLKVIDRCRVTVCERRLRIGDPYRIARDLAGTSSTDDHATDHAGHHSNDEGTLRGVPDPIAGWLEPDGEISDAAIREVWAILTAGDAFGTFQILRSPMHPRMFAIERGRRGVIVVPERITSPQQRFAVLHELGHAQLWLAECASQIEWPRVVDEAAASYTARAMEDPDALPPGWHSPLATAARVRRTQLAGALAGLEDRLVRGDVSPMPIECPPLALWTELGMQRVYHAAEQLADGLPAGLAGEQLVRTLGSRAHDIDDGAFRPAVWSIPT